MKYRIAKYGNNNAWSLTPIRIAGDTIERGKNKGQPNPQAGQEIPIETATTYPGTLEQAARALLEKAFNGYEIDLEVGDFELKLQEFNVAIEKAAQQIARELSEVTSATIEVDEVQ